VHSDTRTLRPGDLFVALRGERFDGHAFLAQAQAAGAVAALAESGLGTATLPGLRVGDTLAALQQLAAGLARAPAPAADRRHRQQRQDDGDADDRRHPGSVARQVHAGHRRQPQQPHRRAADAAAACARTTTLGTARRCWNSA